ncbi:MAG: hypothetical protein RBS19_01950 [Bacteroidales bacterium]|nr:hypothetical protein [Bacteroidales bacterium]
MKNPIKLLIFLLIIGIMPYAESQAVTSPHKKTKKTTSQAKSPIKNARRGGRETLPTGLKDKSWNIGFGTGIANPGMELKAEEYANIGLTGNVYAHFLLKGSPTVGLGIYSNYSIFPVNNRKYALRYKHPESVTTPMWSINSMMASFLFNFTIEERISAQLMTNAGVIYTQIPKTTVKHSDTALVAGYGYQLVEYQFTNANSSNIGFSALVNFNFAYALSPNVEVKAGVEWQYMRISYMREWYKPEIKQEEIFRQFQSLNGIIGLSINF